MGLQKLTSSKLRWVLGSLSKRIFFQSGQFAAESGLINEDAKMASLKLKTSAFIGKPKM